MKTRMNRSVMLVCAALTTMLACANRQDASVNEATTAAELKRGDHGDATASG